TTLDPAGGTATPLTWTGAMPPTERTGAAAGAATACRDSGMVAAAASSVLRVRPSISGFMARAAPFA
ncbi:MAG: hypothetical protein ABF665_12490, partial [Gluconacetobacter sp.]